MLISDCLLYAKSDGRPLPSSSRAGDPQTLPSRAELLGIALGNVFAGFLKFWISTAARLHLADRPPKSCRCVIQRLRRTYLARLRTTFTRHVRAFQRSLFDSDHNSHGRGGLTMFARIGVMRR